MMAMFKKYKPVLWVVLITFLINTVVTEPVQADVPFLPKPGQLVSLTASFSRPTIMGLRVFRNNPFKFEFVMSKGDEAASNTYENPLATQAFLKEEANKLVKYFLASLTIPQKDLWVNLSPYERDRIIPKEFGITEMGKELLVQDYLLKQVTASVMYPEGQAGKTFWKKIYHEAYERFGTTNIPVNTFNKVWIVPDKATVYENAVDNTVVIVDSKLKVMLEEDYLSLKKHSTEVMSAASDLQSKSDGRDLAKIKDFGGLEEDYLAMKKHTGVIASEAKQSFQKIAASPSAPRNDTRALGSQLIRQIILPLLEKEVNTGKNFAVLRQVYHSLILALWYKNKLKQSLIAQGYVDRKKTNSVDVADKNVDQEIYQQYLKSYKKGVYNYIKEETAPDNAMVPRKYFSGGIAWGNLAMTSIKGPDAAMRARGVLGRLTVFAVTVGLAAVFATLPSKLSAEPPPSQPASIEIKAPSVQAPALTAVDLTGYQTNINKVTTHFEHHVEDGEIAEHIYAKYVKAEYKGKFEALKKQGRFSLVKSIQGKTVRIADSISHGLQYISEGEILVMDLPEEYVAGTSTAASSTTAPPSSTAEPVSGNTESAQAWQEATVGPTDTDVKIYARLTGKQDNGNTYRELQALKAAGKVSLVYTETGKEVPNNVHNNFERIGPDETLRIKLPRQAGATSSQPAVAVAAASAHQVGAPTAPAPVAAPAPVNQGTPVTSLPANPEPAAVLESVNPEASFEPAPATAPANYSLSTPPASTIPTPTATAPVAPTPTAQNLVKRLFAGVSHASYSYRVLLASNGPPLPAPRAPLAAPKPPAAVQPAGKLIHHAFPLAVQGPGAILAPKIAPKAYRRVSPGALTAKHNPLEVVLNNTPINYDGTEPQVDMKKRAGANLSEVYQKLFFEGGMAAIGGIDRNNLNAPEKYIDDFDEFMDFLSDENTEIVIKALPIHAGPLDSADIDDDTKYPPISPEDVYSNELAGRVFVPYVKKYVDEDGTIRKGILWTGTEAAETMLALVESWQHDKEVKDAMAKIFSILDPNVQREELAKPEMAKIFKDAKLPAKGKLITNAKIIPDKFGNDGKVASLLAEGSVVQVQRQEPFQRVAYVVKNDDGTTTRELEFVGSYSGVWIQFDEIDADKEKLLNDKEHRERASQHLAQYGKGGIRAALKRPRYVLGANMFTREITQKMFGAYAAEQERNAVNRAIELQKWRIGLSVVLGAGNLVMSAAGIPGGGLISAGGNLIFDVSTGITLKKDLPGPISDEHKDELTGWVLYSLSNSSSEITFAEWQKTKQTNPSIYEQWKKKGHIFRTSAFSERQIAEVDNFLQKRFTEAEVGKILSIVQDLVNVTGQALGLDTYTVSGTKLVKLQGGAYGTYKGFAYFQVPRYNALTQVLTQPYIAWDGSSINLTQSAILIASLAYNGQMPNLVSIHDAINGGANGIKQVSTWLPYLGVLVDVSADVHSAINALQDDPLNSAFINSPKKFRLNLGFLAGIVPVSAIWELHNLQEQKRLWADDSIEAIVVEDGLFRSHSYGYTAEDMKKLSLRPGEAKITVTTVTDGRHVIKVPVYVKYDPTTKKKTVLILKPNAIKRSIEDLKKFLKTYEDAQRTAAVGSISEQVGPDSGTYWENILSTHFYGSYSQAGQIFYPLAKSVDQLNMVLRAIAGNDKQKARDLLAEFYGHLRTNTKLGEDYPGAPESWNFETGQAVTKDRPQSDRVSSALFGLGLIEFNKAFPDEIIDKNAITDEKEKVAIDKDPKKKIKKAKEQVDEAVKMIHDQLLKDAKDGLVKNGDESALMYAFFERVGDPKAALKMVEYARKNFWDGHLFKFKASESGYASSTVLLWLRVLGPQGFAKEFLGGASNTDALVNVIQDIIKTFGQEQDKTLGLLDAVDSTIRDRYDDRGDVGFVAETADFVGVLKHILSASLPTPLALKQRDDIQKQIDFYSSNLQKFKDAHNKGGAPSIPEATKYGKHQVPSGKDSMTAFGTKALGALIEYETQVLHGVDLLSPIGSPGVLPALPNADPVPEAGMGHTTIIEADKSTREKLQRELGGLIAQEKAGKKPTVDERYVEKSGRGPEYKVSQHGLVRHLVLTGTKQELDAYRALLEHQAENARRYAQAIRGEGEFALGAAILKEVGPNNALGTPTVGNGIGQDRVFDSKVKAWIMQEIERLPDLQKDEIERKYQYNNFTMDLESKDLGLKGRYVLSLVSPQVETIVPLVNLDTKEPYLKVFGKFDKSPGTPQEVIRRPVRNTMTITSTGITVYEYTSSGAKSATHTYHNTLDHKQGVANPKDYVATIHQMLGRHQLLLDKKRLVIEYNDATPTDDTQVVSREIAIDRDGNIELETYSVHPQPIQVNNRNFITVNHFNAYGRLQKFEQFDNDSIPYLLQPPAGVGKDSTAYQEYVQRLVDVLKNPNPKKGALRYVTTTPVRDTDRDLSRFGGGRLPMVQRNVKSGAVRNFVIDLATGLKQDIGTHSEGVRQNTHMEYDGRFGWKVSSKSVTKGHSGAEAKSTGTLDYDPVTQLTMFQEIDMSSGKPVVTIKVVDPRFEGYIAMYTQEAEGNTFVESLVQYNRDETAGSVVTKRQVGLAPGNLKDFYQRQRNPTAGVLLSDGRITLSGGKYLLNYHQYTEGKRVNKLEQTQNVYSATNGLLLSWETLNPWHDFNPSVEKSVLRAFFVSYDADGIQTNGGREYMYSPKYDRQNNPYDGTVVLGTTSAGNKPQYYFRWDPVFDAEGKHVVKDGKVEKKRQFYTVKGEVLNDTKKADVVGRFINRGNVFLSNVPPEQGAYANRPLAYIEEQDDQGRLLKVRYVSEVESREVANASESTYEPNTYELLFNTAEAFNTVYGMTPEGDIQGPVATTQREKTMTKVADVFGYSGHNVVDTIRYERRDYKTHALQREFGLNPFYEENVNFYYSPEEIFYNFNADETPKAGYAVRGRMIVGTFDQSVRGIFHYDDQYRLVGRDGKLVGNTPTEKDLVGKATRVQDIDLNIPPSIEARLAGGKKSVAEEKDFIKGSRRFFVVDDALHRQVVELNPLPSDKDHRFVAQVIFNPFIAPSAQGVDRQLYRANVQPNKDDPTRSTVTIDDQQMVISTTNLRRGMSLDAVIDDPIIEEAIGTDNSSNHRPEARKLFTKTVQDIARELGVNDYRHLTFNIVQDKINKNGTHFFVRIDQDPVGRIILYESSDVSPSLVINMKFSGPSPTQAYEISQDSQIYLLSAGQPQTLNDFFAEKGISKEFKDKNDRTLTGAAVLNKRFLTPVSRDIVLDPQVRDDGSVVSKGHKTAVLKGLVLVRYLGDNDPLARDDIKFDRGDLRFILYDESENTQIPLTVPEGEIAVDKVGSSYKVIRQTEYLQRAKNDDVYIYKVPYEYKDGYDYTARDNIFVGYNFRTGLIWEHYVNDGIKIYSLDAFPIGSVRVPTGLEEFQKGINDPNPDHAPKEFLYSLFTLKGLFGVVEKSDFKDVGVDKDALFKHLADQGYIKVVQGEIGVISEVKHLVQGGPQGEIGILSDTARALKGPLDIDLPMYSAAQKETIWRILQNPHSYLKASEDIQTPTRNKEAQHRLIRDNRVMALVEDEVNYALDVHEKSTMDQMGNSPANNLFPAFRSSQRRLAANINNAIEAQGEAIPLRAPQLKLEGKTPWTDSVRKFYYITTWLPQRFHFLAQYPLANNILAMLFYLITAGFSTFSFIRLRASRWLKKVGSGESDAILLGKLIAADTQGLKFGKEKDSAMISPQIAKKLLILRQLNGQFIIGANVPEENRGTYLKSYLTSSGFDDTESKAVWRAVKSKELKDFDKTDTDPRDAMEALEIGNGLMTEASLRQLIDDQAKRGYPQALVLKQMVDEGLFNYEVLKNILQKKVPPSYKGQMAWTRLMHLALVESENPVLGMLRVNPQVAEEAILNKLMITPEVRLLKTLLKAGYWKPGDLSGFVEEYYKQPGALGSFRAFVYWLLEEKIIRPAIDDVYNSTFAYAGKGKGINADQKEKVYQSIISEVHRSLMMDPKRITDEPEDKKSTIQFNPYPMMDLLESKDIRHFAMVKFIQMNASDTGGDSLGALSAIYPLTMFVAGDALRILDDPANSGLSRDKRAEKVLKQIRDHVDLWRWWSALNVWGEKAGLFKLLTQPDVMQSEKFRQTDLFIDSDLYKLMMSLNKLNSDGSQKGYILFGAMARLILNKGDKEGGLDPDKSTSERFSQMRQLIEDVEKGGYTTGPITNEEFDSLNAQAKELLEQYSKYIEDGAANKNGNSPEHKAFMDFIKDKILTQTDVFKETMMVFLHRDTPLAVTADRWTKKWKGVTHLWLGKIMAPLLIKPHHFWATPTPLKTVAAYVLMGIGLAVSGVILVTQSYAWGIWGIVLSLGWPWMLLGKAKSVGERFFWMLVYGAASGYQFGILVYHLFGSINTIHFGTFGFWAGVVLLSVMTVPTFVTFFHALNALWSYHNLRKRIWSKAYDDWVGWRAWFRWGKEEDKVGLYRNIILEGMDVERRFSAVTPNGEPVQEFLTGLIRERGIRERSLGRTPWFTKDEETAWITFINHPQRLAPSLPQRDKAREFLATTFFALVQKKPHADNWAYLQATSSHVQSAGESARILFETKSLPGSLDTVETAQGQYRATSLLGHLLTYHRSLGMGLEIILPALMATDDPGIKAFASKLKRITPFDDINELFKDLGLSKEQIGKIVQILEGFLNEVMPNNDAVIESQGIDITQMHDFTAQQLGDYEYADVVKALSLEYSSLKAAKLAIEGKEGKGEALTDQEKMFNDKYAAYRDLVLLKYRPIFHEQFIWAKKWIKKEQGQFAFDKDTEGLFAPWDKETLSKYYSPGDADKLIETQDALRNIYSQAINAPQPTLVLLAQEVLKARSNNITTIIDAFDKLLSLQTQAEDDPVVKFIEGYESFIGFMSAIDKADSTDVYLPFYEKTDNIIPANKNSGLGTNLWVGYRRSSNYDAWVRAYPGQNSYRLSWATLVGRNPDIVVVNPMMRIWNSSNEAFPVTAHYAISQHTFTSDTLRGRENHATFYGKGLITPEAGTTTFTNPAEDSASFLLLQDAYPGVVSTQLDYFGFEWARPTLIKTVLTTEQRYGYNVTRMVMDRTLHAVSVNRQLPYDIKLSHWALFMHYLSIRFGLLLIVALPSLALFSPFANLTPALMWAGASFLFMIAVNFSTIVRHVRETGSVWRALLFTARDTRKAFPMFVGLLVMIDQGVWSATHEVYKFVRTVKNILLKGEKDKKLHEDIRLFTLRAHVSATVGKIVAAAGVVVTIVSVSLGLWTGTSGWYLLSWLGPFIVLSGTHTASRTKEKLPLYGMVGILGASSWLGTLLFSLSAGPVINSLYMLAVVAALTGHKVYTPTYNKEKGRIEGSSGWHMFGGSLGMKLFIGLLGTRILSGWFGVIDSETINMAWGAAIVLTGVWAFKHFIREGIGWGIRDIAKYFGWGRKSTPSGPVAQPPSQPPAAAAPPNRLPSGTQLMYGPKRPGDAAMISRAAISRNRVTPGGIDLAKTAVSVRTSGDFIQTAFDDPAMLRLLLNSDGLAPIVYDVQEMTPSMVNHFVGLN